MALVAAHGKVAVFKIADSGSTMRDISPLLKTDALKRTVETAETSAFASTAKSYLPGLSDATLSMDGYASQVETGYLDGVIALITTFEFSPMGTAAGTPKYTGSCIITTLETTADVGSAVQIKGDLQVTGPITRGAN
jgi:hypothetical protein